MSTLIAFVSLDDEGNTRVIPRDAILKCPHVIMMPEHYRLDNSCRCNDPSDKVMAEWGYVWNGKTWEARNDDDD